MKFKSIRFLAVAALLSLTCMPAWAALQGGPGSTSTAEVNIVVTNGERVRITGLEDYVDVWSGIGDLNYNKDICIGRNGIRNNTIGYYRIRATGSGDPYDINAFTITNGIQQLYYNVYFNDETGLTGRQLLTAGLMLNGQNAMGNTLKRNVGLGCIFVNANISIELKESELLTASSGIYTGKLTLLLIPE